MRTHFKIRGNPVAERPHDGSRGLQPTVSGRSRLRRGATPESGMTSWRSFNRRSATTLSLMSDRGLKPTVTVTASLCEDQIKVTRQPLNRSADAHVRAL